MSPVEGSVCPWQERPHFSLLSPSWFSLRVVLGCSGASVWPRGEDRASIGRPQSRPHVKHPHLPEN